MLSRSICVFVICVLCTSYVVGKNNIKKMKSEGFYEGKAIVYGDQIYVFYYVMDHFMYNYSISGVENKKRVLESVERYYNIIEGQIIVPNDRIKRLVLDRPLDVWSNY